jgi:hypothetical protein
MIIAIRQDDLHKWWPQVRSFITKALTRGYGEYDDEDIHTLLEDGNATLVLAIVDNKVVAGIVTTLIEKPALRELIIMTAGGDHLDSWLPEIMDVFDKIAEEQQADAILVHGRAGWVKKLAPYGYGYVHTTVMKRL